MYTKSHLASLYLNMSLNINAYLIIHWVFLFFVISGMLGQCFPRLGDIYFTEDELWFVRTQLILILTSVALSVGVIVGILLRILSSRYFKLGQEFAFKVY